MMIKEISKIIEEDCKWYGCMFVARECGIKRSTLTRYRTGIMKKINNDVVMKAKELHDNIGQGECMYYKRRVITKHIGRPRKTDF